MQSENSKVYYRLAETPPGQTLDVLHDDGGGEPGVGWHGAVEVPVDDGNVEPGNRGFTPPLGTLRTPINTKRISAKESLLLRRGAV